MKTEAQKYSESNAEAILAYFRGVDGTFVPTPAHPSPRYPMVDDTVGIHTVRLSQSTLAGYLEQAFVAGERAEFDRLDKLIIESKLVPCPYCSEGDPGQCGACHNTRRVMLSQQHEYSLHIRPVPNAACPQCIADKLVAEAEADGEDEKVVKTVWKSARAVRDWPGMVTIRRFSPFKNEKIEGEGATEADAWKNVADKIRAIWKPEWVAIPKGGNKND